jgi:hypothetical protein
MENELMPQKTKASAKAKTSAKKPPVMKAHKPVKLAAVKPVKPTKAAQAPDITKAKEALKVAKAAPVAPPTATKAAPKTKPEKPEKLSKRKISIIASANEAASALAQKWATLHKKSEQIEAKPYNMKAVFEEKTAIVHKILGWGYILANRNDRLEVLFKDGIKYLISNYKP